LGSFGFVQVSATKATCFYDHYYKGKKSTGFGRIVDFWYENGTGHNVPNFIDELIDPNLSPPSWRSVGFLGVLNDSSGSQSVQLPTPSIPANSTVELLFEIPADCWNFDCDFEIRVDVNNQVNEANEGNNSAAGVCAG